MSLDGPIYSFIILHTNTSLYSYIHTHTNIYYLYVQRIFFIESKSEISRSLEIHPSLKHEFKISKRTQGGLEHLNVIITGPLSKKSDIRNPNPLQSGPLPHLNQ